MSEPTRRTPGRRKSEKAEACARRVLEVVPQVMTVLRREMRRGAQWDLSVPQFRVLAFLGRAPGASLSEVADFAGVAPATTSATVERLVRRGLVIRASDPLERRRVQLELSKEGRALLERVRAHIRTRIAGLFLEQGDSDHDSIMDGLDELSRVLDI